MHNSVRSHVLAWRAGKWYRYCAARGPRRGCCRYGECDAPASSFLVLLAQAREPRSTTRTATSPSRDRVVRHPEIGSLGTPLSSWRFSFCSGRMLFLSLSVYRLSSHHHDFRWLIFIIRIFVVLVYTDTDTGTEQRRVLELMLRPTKCCACAMKHVLRMLSSPILPALRMSVS